MTKSLRQIINDYELGELIIYKNEHFYIELSNSGDDIGYYFKIDDDTFCGRFKNKWELLDRMMFNKKSIFYYCLDELLSNDDVVNLEDYFCVVDDNYTQEIKVIHGKYLLSAHEVLFYGTEEECRKYIDEM